jgi:hypothetical protein
MENSRYEKTGHTTMQWQLSKVEGSKLYIHSTYDSKFENITGKDSYQLVLSVTDTIIDLNDISDIYIEKHKKNNQIESVTMVIIGIVSGLNLLS